MTHILYVTSPQTASYTRLSLSGAADPLEIEVDAKLGICPFAFWEADLDAEWPWPDCDTSLGAGIRVTDAAGIQAVDFAMSDYTLFKSLLGVRWSLSAVLSFTPNSKTLTPTLDLQPDWIICPDIEILAEMTGGASIASVDSIRIYGIRGECGLGDLATIRFADSFADDKNQSVTGKAAYFEMIGISGPLPSCCGSTGSFELASYFERPPAPSGALFGLGLFTGSFSVQLAPGFAVSFDADLPVVPDSWKLTWGFRTFW
mgnify:CR=1 FL=1